ncbi:CALML4 [Acrasis kona]|uniref:CALML4 n=1 Tax=Acrasis kona TaxID=1008807 RepID=A0AAW2ZEF0_9EUKA
MSPDSPIVFTKFLPEPVLNNLKKSISGYDVNQNGYISLDNFNSVIVEIIGIPLPSETERARQLFEEGGHKLHVFEALDCAARIWLLRNEYGHMMEETNTVTTNTTNQEDSDDDDLSTTNVQQVDLDAVCQQVLEAERNKPNYPKKKPLFSFTSTSSNGSDIMDELFRRKK